MPGRKEQNKRDLKKASANCYQLDTFFKGIRKTVNVSKNSEELILSRQQSSLDNFYFNVDLEPGSPPPPASPTPPVSPAPGSPQSPNSQQLPDSPQSTESLQSLDSPQPPVSQLSPVSSLASEPPNEVFKMVLNQPLAASACHNQKSLSPNQQVNFKYPKREYKDSNRSFQLQWYKRWKWLHHNEKRTVELATCVGMLICII